MPFLFCIFNSAEIFSGGFKLSIQDRQQSRIKHEQEAPEFIQEERTHLKKIALRLFKRKST
jgi:hypothetical protein